MRRTPGRLAAAAIAAAILSACAGGNPPAPGSADATPQHSAPGAPPAAAYDPPTAFDLTKGVALPVEATRGKVTMAGSIAKPLPLTLDGPTAYIAATDSLQAVDLATGRVKTMITALHQALRPSNQLMDGNPAEAPVIAEVAGKRQAMAAFLTKAAGQGTTADRLVVELATVDTATGTGNTLQNLTIDLPAETLTAYPTSPSATLLAVQGTTAVIAIDETQGGAVLAIDIAAKTVLWKQTRFIARAVTGRQVTGIALKNGAAQRVAGLSLADGGIAWSAEADSYGTEVRPAGPATLVASGRDYGNGKQFTRLLDGATGHEVLALGGAGADCRHDGRSVTVCTDDGSVFAVDDNAQVLWKLPDEANHRIAPTVTAVWHGLVYGSAGHGPVILDTRTGADRPATPGIAPAAVDAYACLALKNDANILVAYPAAG
ncbi:hypothetical protein ACFXDE_25745 [Kitasatospora sp. NPDC059408]|uniref:hypothetical protein n=1 Tax=Kitasatospora sp. NPDC059408 TaxID=3346823 RepID=UPI0036CC0672